MKGEVLTWKGFDESLTISQVTKTLGSQKYLMKHFQSFCFTIFKNLLKFFNVQCPNGTILRAAAASNVNYWPEKCQMPCFFFWLAEPWIHSVKRILEKGEKQFCWRWRNLYSCLTSKHVICTLWPRSWETESRKKVERSRTEKWPWPILLAGTESWKWSRAAGRRPRAPTLRRTRRDIRRCGRTARRRCCKSTNSAALKFVGNIFEDGVTYQQALWLVTVVSPVLNI